MQRFQIFISAYRAKRTGRKSEDEHMNFSY